jgi:nitroimidazol reductase NimA-like FMN-containing flavoprotein (pyridoxamine 5'-phosphate oxidase superfamily)
VSETDRALFDEGLELLDDAECLRLLSTVSLGRVGVTIASLPAIFPVNFALHDGDVLFRTGDGAKLRAALRGAVVVFEADHADAASRSGWSVQAVGVAEEVTEELGDLVSVAPWASGARHHLVRIHPEMLTGRRIRGITGP